METIAGVFSAIARGLRGLLDLALMAMGVAPNAAGLGSALSAGIASTSNVQHGSLKSRQSTPEEYEFSETFNKEVGWTNE